MQEACLFANVTFMQGKKHLSKMNQFYVWKKESLYIPFRILWETFLMRILFKWIHSHFECIYSFMNKFETIFPEKNSIPKMVFDYYFKSNEI